MANKICRRAFHFSGDGFNLSFTLTGTTTFTGTFSDMHGNSDTGGGTLIDQTANGGEGIAQVRLFNFNAGNGDNNNVFFNNMAIVPEPATLSFLLTGSSLLGAFVFVRRRRA